MSVEFSTNLKNLRISTQSKKLTFEALLVMNLLEMIFNWRFRINMNSIITRKDS